MNQKQCLVWNNGNEDGSKLGCCNKEDSFRRHEGSYAPRVGTNKTCNKNVANEEINKAVAKDAEEALKNNEGFLMVHTPIAINDAIKIDQAKEALEVEWLKLEKGTKSGPAWAMTKPRSKEEVKREA